MWWHATSCAVTCDDMWHACVLWHVTCVWWNYVVSCAMWWHVTSCVVASSGM